tara:strand:- start:450 stop:728 length:279 start_codon:yes stop_codon:yes gene_type:complete
MEPDPDNAAEPVLNTNGAADRDPEPANADVANRTSVPDADNVPVQARVVESSNTSIATVRAEPTPIIAEAAYSIRPATDTAVPDPEIDADAY